MKQHKNKQPNIGLILFVITLITGFTVSTHTLAKPTSFSPVARPCPTSFYHILLINDARQCQQFDDSLPASLVYFTHRQVHDVIRFYQTQDTSLIVHGQKNNRTVLKTQDDSVRIVVSPDHQGTQVDILVITTK